MRQFLLGASVAALVFSATLLSCTKANPKFCAGDNDCDGTTCDIARGVCSETDASVPDAETPDAATCVGQTDCTNPSAPICDDTDMICRGCSPAGASQECLDIDIARGLCSVDGRCGECTPTQGCVALSETPVCETTTLSCRGCSSGAECPDSARTVCAGDGRCVECDSHDDCAGGSEVCDISAGTCVAAAAVLYVGGANAGDDSGCGASNDPCATIDFGLGRMQSKTHMRIRDGSYSDNLDIDNTAITLVGPGATLSSPAGSNPTVTIRGGATVTIDGLTVRGATGGAAGVDCDGSSTTLTFVRARAFFNMGPGIKSSDCLVTVLESSIDGNVGLGMLVTNGTLVVKRSIIKGNSLGGIHAALTPYEIINNFIIENGTGGSGGSSVAGLRFDNGAESGDQTLAFNTIADNDAISTAPSFGVRCEVSGGATSVVSSNIVYNGAGQTVVSGSCVWSFSNYEGAPVGTRGNIDSDPDFKDRAGDDYELKATSPCRDKGEDLAAVTTDHEGDERPAGAKDIGADEVDL